MGYSSTALRAVKTAVELAIPHEMTTAEWAETYRFVDRGARKGRWSNDTLPFLTEIMASADDPLVREIVFMKSSQVGGSEVINNIFGKRIHQSPTEIIYCAEKEDKAKAWTQEAFDSMVRVTPELKQLIGTSSADNNQNVKRFPGGGLYIVWATSPAELSSRPAQIIAFDEKAAYKPTNEGDAVKLGEARTKTYDGDELIIKNSTPRRCDCFSANDTCSDISHDYLRGDQREYYVPCPHCSEFQTLKFGGKDTAFGLKWDADTPESPYYICEHCSAVIEEFDREDMLLAGRWVAHAPFNGVASFRINQIYSPFVSWGRMVLDFLEAKTSAAKLEVYTNTVLGETWKPVEQIEYEDLSWNLEVYEADVPNGVLCLTAGVDVQKDRLECFDDITEVLTEDGWQRFATLGRASRVGTVNLDTNLIEFQEPTDYISRPHSGSLVSVQSSTTSIAVTPNHRMLAFKSQRDINADKPQIVLAGELKKGHRLKCQANWGGKTPGPIALPTSYYNLGNGNLHERRGRIRLRYQINGVRTEKHFKTRAEAEEFYASVKHQVAVNEPERHLDPHVFAAFLGWYVAEGHTAFHKDYRVFITQNVGPYFEEICSIITKLGFNYSVHAKDKKRVIKISSKQLYEYVREHCGIGSAEKRVPSFIKEGTPALIEVFLEAYNRGDGWVMSRNDETRKNQRYFGTCSRQLADDIQELIIKTGRRANVSFRAAKNPNRRDFYNISELSSRQIHITSRNLSEVFYDGQVYCVTVPNGTLICRRNGKMFIAGNCEVVGWGRDHESWSIDYKVFEGPTGIEAGDTPDDDETMTNVWTEMAEYLQSSFNGTGGQTFRIQCVAIDSGYQTAIVYKFCKRYAAKRWFAVKGMSDPFKPLLSKPTLSGQNPKVRLFPIGTNAAKDEVFASLKVASPGPAYCHFPDRQPYNEDAHMKQLASERMVTHTSNARTYRRYEKVSPNVRNEALDVRVYATAARVILNPNYEAIAKRRLLHGEAADRPERPISEPQTASREKPAPPNARNVVPFRGQSLTKNNPFEGYKP